MVPVAAGILTITFALVHVAGDPTDLDFEGSDPRQVELVRRELGLDRPLPERFLDYAADLVRGDLGRSFAGPRVTDLIGERIGPTALLVLSAVVLSTLVGLALGLLAARRPSGPADVLISTGTLLGFAVPSFWLAQLAVFLVVLRTGWFPVEGLTDARGGHEGLAAVVDVAHHLMLPVAVLATSEVALVARVTRAGLLRQLQSSYVTTARAKGVPPDLVLSGHALPNTMVTLATIIGSRIGFVFSGAVLVETVFAWPGLGTLLVQSAQGRDQPVVLGLVLLTSAGVMVANLATDLVATAIDPRIEHR